MIYAISRFAAWCLLKAFFSFKVYGRENLPKRGSFILASNHVSYADPIALGVACFRKCNFMAKSDLFKNKLFAWYLGSLNVFPVKRGSADYGALKEALRRLKGKDALILFPEGSRQDAETLSKEPEPGVGFLADKAGVAVIPAFIKGTQEALPKGLRFPRPCSISVRFGKKINIERGLSYEGISQIIMQQIKNLA
ncbi:MAG: lysophospholipid acyltransferase family protein [Candidatus Omnitrophota bacterium]